MFVVGACARPTVNPAAEFSVGDAMDLRATFDALYGHISRLDAPATLAAYDTSIAFAHVFDGNLVRGRARYNDMVKAMFPTIRAFENAGVDSVFIIPAGKNAAMVVAAFHETVVDTAGARTTQRGIWSNLFIRRPNGWKVVFGHTTHVVDPTR